MFTCCSAFPCISVQRGPTAVASRLLLFFQLSVNSIRIFKFHILHFYLWKPMWLFKNVFCIFSLFTFPFKSLNILNIFIKVISFCFKICIYLFFYMYLYDVLCKLYVCVHVFVWVSTWAMTCPLMDSMPSCTQPSTHIHACI